MKKLMLMIVICVSVAPAAFAADSAASMYGRAGESTRNGGPLTKCGLALEAPNKGSSVVIANSTRSGTPIEAGTAR